MDSNLEKQGSLPNTKTKKFNKIQTNTIKTDTIQNEGQGYGHFAKSSMFNASANLGVKFISFIYMLYISRVVPESEIGLFYLGLSVISLLAIFSDLGMNSSLVRYVPYLRARKEYSKLRLALKLSLGIGSALAFVVSILVFIFSLPISVLINRPELSPILKLLSIYLFISRFGAIINNFLLSEKKIKQYTIYQVIVPIVKLFAIFGLIIYLGATANMLSWALILSQLLGLSFIAWVVVGVYRSIPKPRVVLPKKTANSFVKEYVSFGVISAGITAFAVIFGSTDKILLSIFNVSNASIGIYSLVFSFVALLSIVPTSINSILMPMVSEFYGKKQMGQMRSITQFATKLIMILIGPFLLILLLLSKDVIVFVYGHGYATGALALVILSLGIYIRHMGTPAIRGLSAMMRLDIEFKIILFAAVANLIFDAILIPMFGINGAALGTALSSFVLFGSIMHYSGQLYKFKLPKNALKILFGLAISFVLLYYSFSSLDIVPRITKWIMSFSITAFDGQFFGVLVHKTLVLFFYGVIFGISTIVLFGILILLKCFELDEYNLLKSALLKYKLPAHIRKLFLKVFGWGVSYTK